MKKFTLTLLLIFGTVSALFAQQSVREDIFAFLKREGYVPTFDEDRDILFKVQGINYYAIIKEVADMDYAYVEVSANFTADVPYDKLLAISNDQNRDKFVCKCSAERDGEDNCFKVAMEFITNNRTKFVWGWVPPNNVSCFGNRTAFCRRFAPRTSGAALGDGADRKFFVCGDRCCA